MRTYTEKELNIKRMDTKTLYDIYSRKIDADQETRRVVSREIELRESK